MTPAQTRIGMAIEHLEMAIETLEETFSEIEPLPGAYLLDQAFYRKRIAKLRKQLEKLRK